MKNQDQMINKTEGNQIPAASPEAEEQVQHGDIFLPVNSYHCLVPDTYTELVLHWHAEMEITLIQEGTSDYRIGQEHFRTGRGDLLVVPPMTLHSAFEIPGQTMVSDSLVFHLNYLGASEPDLSASRYLRPLMQGQFQCPFRIQEGSEGYSQIHDVFLQALHTFQTREAFYELLLKERLLQLLYLMFHHGYIRKHTGQNIPSDSSRQLQHVLRYIDDHYQEHITIASLAKRSGFSESYFMSFFKREAGMSCISYVNHVRIQKAAQTLESTALPVLEIAMENGFDNISYFNRQFRRQFHMTPGEFRKLRQSL